MKSRNIIFKYPKAFGVFILTIIFVLGSFTVDVAREQQGLRIKSNLAFRENVFKDRFQEVLRGAQVVTRSVAFLAERDLLNDDFDEVASRLLMQSPGIAAVQLLENTTIIKTFPSEGNEHVQGLDIAKYTSHAASLNIVRDRDDIYFEGPFVLQQGYLGIVGRYPIFKENELWGFSAVIIRCDTLRKHLGVDEFGKSDDYIFQVENLFNTDQTNSLFNNELNISSTGEFISKSEILDWKLIVKADTNILNYSYAYFLIGILALISGLLSWYLTRLPEVLRERINKRTLDLISTTNMLNQKILLVKDKDAELERISFATSHHLQEPVRLIEMYISRYKKQMSRNKELSNEELLLLKVISEYDSP